MTEKIYNNIKPLIAIIGRPNVGKSTLFNSILKKNASIVDDMPGVTRDLHYEDMEHEDKPFTLIDTGGFHIDEEGDAITLGIRRQIEEILNTVDGVILLVDGESGIHPSDKEIYRLIKRNNIRHWVAVSKIDDVNRDAWAMEFYELGVEEVFPCSGKTGHGVFDLLEEVTKDFWTSKEIAEKLPPPESEIKLCIIGRPNVGKSTLVNAMLGEERMLVSPIPGTTMDPIDSCFHYKNQKFRVIDTAGIRRKKNIDMLMEKAAVVRAFKSIDRSDIVIFLLDPSEIATDQDLKILGLAHEKNKAIVIAVNKWDIVEKDDKTFDRLVKDIRDRIKFAPYAPIISISALEKLRINKLLDLTMEVFENYKKKIDDDELMEWLEHSLRRQPPPLTKKNKMIYFRSITMDSVMPPTVVIGTSHPNDIHFSYQRFLLNQFYEKFGYKGVSVKFVFKRSQRRKNDKKS